MSYFRSCYNTLTDIIVKGKYLGEGLKTIPDDKDKALVTRIVYGVLEKKVQLDYYISCLTSKKPKKALEIILEIGLYCLRYTQIPPYAVCDNAVKLTKDIGKSGAAPFINATLKKSKGYDSIPQDKTERLSVLSSTPLWITKKIVKQYKEKAKDILCYTPDTKGHVRVNGLKTTKDEVEKILLNNGIDFDKTDSGFYVSDSEIIRELFKEGKITYQSESSVKIAELVAKSNPKTVFDVCAAPGGKSIYIYELTKAKVLSQDLHAHRAELIKSYAQRMSADISVSVGDGCVVDEKKISAFDAVLLDAPCSGIGTRYTKPDVLINRQEADIPEFSKTQESLLDVACLYVKTGGALVYSTCTLFYEENERVVERFLAKHKEFRLIDEIKRVPGENSRDGFYAVRLEKFEDVTNGQNA